MDSGALNYLCFTGNIAVKHGKIKNQALGVAVSAPNGLLFWVNLW